MDNKDKKILKELILNSRAPYSKIAKRVGLSREVVTYRIKRLVNEGVIMGFFPLINLEGLGYRRNGCWMQFRGISKEKEKNFLDYLIRNPHITYAGTIVGKWNVAFDIISKDKEDLKSIILEILGRAGKYLGKYIVTNNASEEEIYDMKLIGEKKEIIKKRIEINYKLNSLDKKILKLISKDSRIDYISLSSRLNLTANAIKYRIKMLEKVGVILGYTISINTNKLGFEFYNIQIRLNSNMDRTNLKKFLKNHMSILYFYNYLGQENWDMDIGVIAKNYHDLRNIIMDLREEIKGDLEIQDIYVSVDVLKSNIAPEGVFN